MSTVTNQPGAVPLVERLRAIPEDARLTYEYSVCHHGMFPAGLLAHEAVALIQHQQERIAALEAGLREGRDALQVMMNAWFDYHDSHSLTQPVTGAAGNAFDRALEARDSIDALLGGEG